MTAAASSHPVTVSAGHRPPVAAAAAATATTASARTLPAGSSGTGSGDRTPGQPGEKLPYPARRRTEPAQPAPHRLLRDPGRRRDTPEPLTPRRPRQHVPDHRRPVAPPRQQPRRKQHMRHTARTAPRPPRTHRHRDPPRHENPPPGRMTPPAQPATTARTPKQAATEQLLDASHVVPYREHRCSHAPTALPELRQKVTGRADPNPTRSRCRRAPATRNPNPGKHPAHRQRRAPPTRAHREWRLTPGDRRWGVPSARQRNGR